MFDIDLLRLLSDWLQFILAGAMGGGLALWGALGRRDRAVLTQLRELSARIDAEQARQDAMLSRLEHSRASAEECRARGGRLVACEQALALGVHHQDLAAAHQRMDRFESKLGEISGLLEGVAHSLDILNQHLITYGPRAGDRP